MALCCACAVIRCYSYVSLSPAGEVSAIRFFSLFFEILAKNVEQLAKYKHFHSDFLSSVLVLISLSIVLAHTAFSVSWILLLT